MNRKLLEPISLTNPIVFLDIKIGQEYAGRIVIELRADVVPKSAENFRALCTGEYGIGKCGKPLHYKGIRFHKVTRIFVSHSGDIVNNNGTSGESIYGEVFDDENFELPHEEGVISMVNYGKPNTNNSQFVITSITCANLDGSNVVVGRVLRGFGVVSIMEQNTSDEGEPTQEIVITECGQFFNQGDWGVSEDDNPDDFFPLYPQDWEFNLNSLSVEEIITILTNIRNAGNSFYKSDRLYDARRKYRKAIRYYNAINHEVEEEVKELEPLSVLNHVNMAIVELKLGEYANAICAATEALRLDPHNTKGFYRRGQAHLALNNFDEAIEDLKSAYGLQPESKAIQDELNRAIETKNAFDREQRKYLKNLFTVKE